MVGLGCHRLGGFGDLADFGHNCHVDLVVDETVVVGAGPVVELAVELAVARFLQVFGHAGLVAVVAAAAAAHLAEAVVVVCFAFVETRDDFPRVDFENSHLNSYWRFSSSIHQLCPFSTF